MASIGIKLNNGKGEFLRSVSEYTAEGSLKPILFETIAEAEIYAQNHEIKNFAIETWNQPASSSARLLT